jgi:hypothetical protein
VSAFTTTEKLMQTFRLSRDLVTFLKAEATRSGLDLTAHVTRILDGTRTWFGLPAAATTLLEADREALGMERHEYLLHLLYQRGLESFARRARGSTPRAQARTGRRSNDLSGRGGRPRQVRRGAGPGSGRHGRRERRRA